MAASQDFICARDMLTSCGAGSDMLRMGCLLLDETLRPDPVGSTLVFAEVSVDTRDSDVTLSRGDGVALSSDFASRSDGGRGESGTFQMTASSGSSSSLSSYSSSSSLTVFRPGCHDERRWMVVPVLVTESRRGG